MTFTHFVYKFIRNINMSEMFDLWFYLLYFSKQLCASSTSSVTVKFMHQNETWATLSSNCHVLHTHAQRRHIESSDRIIEQYLRSVTDTFATRTHYVSISYHAMRWNGLKTDNRLVCIDCNNKRFTLLYILSSFARISLVDLLRQHKFAIAEK